MVRSRRSGRGGQYRLVPPTWHRLSTPTVSTWIGRVLAAMICLASLGCGSKEPVRHYKVPKPEVLYAANHIDAAEKKGATLAPDEPTDRLLGAIVPRETQTWYFKMTGPMKLVAQQEPAFRQLIESLRFAGPDASPTWTLPDSWQEDEGTGQRMATLSVEVEGRKLEVSIIQLGTGPSPNSILDNINRWRRQMRLPLIEMDQLEQETAMLELADGAAVFVNLVGNFESGGMGSGAMTNAGGMAKEAPQPPPEPPKTDLQYEKPDAWLVEPPVSFSVLAFGVRDGNATAQITVSPLKGDAGGLLANVNRWYSQAGLPPIGEQDLATKTEEIVVQGIRGSYAEAIGEDTEAAGEAIVGWIGFESGQTWFVKIKGDRKLVRDQRETFRNFLKTLKFSANDGAGNGN